MSDRTRITRLSSFTESSRRLSALARAPRDPKGRWIVRARGPARQQEKPVREGSSRIVPSPFRRQSANRVGSPVGCPIRQALRNAVSATTCCLRKATASLTCSTKLAREPRLTSTAKPESSRRFPSGREAKRRSPFRNTLYGVRPDDSSGPSRSKCCPVTQSTHIGSTPGSKCPRFPPLSVRLQILRRPTIRSPSPSENSR